MRERNEQLCDCTIREVTQGGLSLAAPALTEA